MSNGTKRELRQYAFDTLQLTDPLSERVFDARDVVGAKRTHMGDHAPGHVEVFDKVLDPIIARRQGAEMRPELRGRRHP